MDGRIPVRFLLPILSLLALSVPALAKDKTKDVIDPGHAENAAVSINATAYTQDADIRKLLGSDFGEYYTVVQVTVTPKAPKYKVDPDDFMLRTDKDGERTQPLAPSQIAGKADMARKWGQRG